MMPSMQKSRREALLDELEDAERRYEDLQLKLLSVNYEIDDIQYELWLVDEASDTLP